MDSSLPIDSALPALTAALKRNTSAVLVAPPGAGKTTRVPLVLLDEPWARGRILLLEPRRLAARAAAARMAATLGEPVGDTVGLRVRFGSKISNRTRIEVITEGVFTRMVLDDPALENVSAVLFDEFHERSLDADLGLALARDVQQGLRDDLKILVMSATLDGARIAKLLGDAPVVESAGRSFPVETRHLPRDPRDPIERSVAAAAVRSLQADTGSLLIFLPGAAEIRRTAALLAERVSDPAVEVHALHGALDQRAQDQAIAPALPGKRKVVLATSIAETSLTIDGVRVVIDSGLARVPRYEPDVGLTRLETVRVSRAAADQRRGRAGRTQPGICYRLWEEPQTAGLEPYAQPEILAADLSGFLLDLAHWGVSDPAKLCFLDAPPQPAINEARALLLELGALDRQGRITEEGKLLRALPLPPRLARMIVDAAREGAGRMAAEIAVVLTERGLGGNDVDLRHRIDELRRDRSPRGQEARRMAERWAAESGSPSPLEGEGWGGGSKEMIPPSRTAPRSDLPLKGGGEKKSKRRGEERSLAVGEGQSIGALLALAYPDRVARNRGGGANSFLLANGRGAQLDPASPLSREPFLVVAELAGRAVQSRILLAAPITLTEIEARFAGQIQSREEVVFDKASASLRARRSRSLGTILLNEQAIAVEAGEAAAHALAMGIRQLGLDRLPWTKALMQWRDRVLFLRRHEGDEWPDLSDAALIETLDDWLTPFLAGKTALAGLSADEFATALESLLSHALRRRLEQEAPTHFAAPSGSRLPIEYTEEGPKLSIRVQELFGLDRHPAVAGGRSPLILELLSPAHRPVQVTRDLPSFWRGSYAAVKSEMRGRYPRHPWPDDPTAAAATRRAKPRKE